MKNLSCVEEGIWVERLEPTEEQLQKLINGTQEEKLAVSNSLNITPKKADITVANRLFNEHKPTDDNYTLISCDLTIDEEVRGIINYRINNEHKQIRF